MFFAESGPIASMTCISFAVTSLYSSVLIARSSSVLISRKSLTSTSFNVLLISIIFTRYTNLSLESPNSVSKYSLKVKPLQSPESTNYKF